METIRIDILNPKAMKLLKNLADLNLIKISDEKKNTDFSCLLRKIRTSSKATLSIEDITNEVEQVRASRYDEKKNNS